MKQPVALPGSINGDALDRFTIAHGALGFAMGVLGAPGWAAVSWALGWELLERVLKDRIPRAFPNATQDTAPNAILDAGAVIGGWWLGRKLRGTQNGKARK